MGLGDSVRSNMRFIGIFGDHIVREWYEKPAEGKIPEGKELMQRVNTNDRTIYYIEYNFIEGDLTNVEIKSDNYGDKISMTFHSDGQEFILKIGLEGSHGMSFMQKMGNIDVNQPLKLKPWKMTGEKWGKLTGFKTTAEFKYGITLSQGDTKLVNHWTKDNGLPEVKITTRGNKTKYDKSERVDFLYEKLEAFMKTVSNRDYKKPVETVSKEVKTDTEEEFLF